MAGYLKYKNYYGTVEYSSEDKLLYGKVVGINDLVNYEGTSIDELNENFKEAVNDYLETCKELGKEPEKVYKGMFNVRTSNKRHRELAIIASKRNIKLNEVVNISFDYLIKHEDIVFNESGENYKIEIG